LFEIHTITNQDFGEFDSEGVFKYPNVYCFPFGFVDFPKLEALSYTSIE